MATPKTATGGRHAPIEQVEPATRADQRSRDAWQDAWQNIAWAQAHQEELEARYAGHWVCVAGGALVVVDADRVRFLERERGGGWHRPGQAPYVFYIPTEAEAAAVHPLLHAADH